MQKDFLPSIAAPGLPAADAWWFVFSGYQLLVKVSGDEAAIPVTEEIETLGVDISCQLYLGSYRGRSCYAVEGKLPSDGSALASFHELRSLFSCLENDFYEIALLAVHLIEWDKACRFCSSCSGTLQARSDMRAKECPMCGRLEFPRISPAIIVLIEKGDTILLARSPRFRGAFFSVLAGFVEPGESLEEAVHREVKEEASIAIKDVAYFGSQPWPFPDSLMIGFTAQYESGEILVDGVEIIEAGWYKADNLPQIPGKLSIAGQLIDWFVKKHSQDRRFL
jgi:NAD+ diphosphatase